VVAAARGRAAAEGEPTRLDLRKPARSRALPFFGAVLTVLAAAAVGFGVQGGRPVKERASRSVPRSVTPEAVEVVEARRLADSAQPSLTQKRPPVARRPRRTLPLTLDPPPAFADSRAADPARESMDAARERARDIYRKAYVERELDPDAARRGFELVASLLPESDEMAQKARRWIDQLSGKMPEDG
jgi:hypothetical protein